MKTRIKSNKIFCNKFNTEFSIEQCINLCQFYKRIIHLNNKDFIYCRVQRGKS